MATNSTNTPTAEQIAVAQWRFGLVAPVIQNTYLEVSEMAYYRRITEQSLTRPDGIEVQLSPNTLQKWTSEYRRYGFEALIPKERADKGSTRVLTPEAEEEIRRVLEKFPRLKGQQICDHLKENGFSAMTLSPRSVQRYIRNHDLRNPVYRQEKDRKAFEAEEFGDIWQADTCYFPYITEDGKNRRTYCICILDDHSRLVVGSEMFYEDTAANFQKVLKDAIARFGIPRKLLLDNGAPYSNEQLLLICGTLGIVIVHARPRDGAEKGKQERYWRRVKEQLLFGMDTSEIHSLRQFNEIYADYVHKYNHSFHQGINGKPYERYEHSAAKLRRPESEEWLNTSFMNRVTRKVKGDATVTIDKIQYDVPQQFIRCKVEIRYVPHDMSTACVYSNGQKYPIRKTNKVENSKTRRATSSLSLDYSKVGA